MNKQLMAILIMDIPAIIFASVAGYMAVNKNDIQISMAVEDFKTILAEIKKLK